MISSSNNYTPHEYVTIDEAMNPYKVSCQRQNLPSGESKCWEGIKAGTLEGMRMQLGHAIRAGLTPTPNLIALLKHTPELFTATLQIVQVLFNAQQISNQCPPLYMLT